MLDVNASGSNAAAAAELGSVADVTIGNATIPGRQVLFAYNRLLHPGDLFPAPASGLPNPLSDSKVYPLEGAFRAPATDSFGETTGAFIFSDQLDKGYEMVNAFQIPIGADAFNLRFRYPASGTTYNVDLQGLVATSIDDLATQLTDLFNAAVGGGTDFAVFWNDAGNRFVWNFVGTIAITGTGVGFDPVDPDSAWSIFGFTHDVGSATASVQGAVATPAFLSINGGNYNARITQSATTVNTDIRQPGGNGVFVDGGDTVVIRDPRQVGGRLQALLRASSLPDAASFRIRWSSTTRLFTVTSDTAFSIDVDDDEATLWRTLGFTGDHAAATTQTSDIPVSHSEESTTLFLGETALAFDDGRAYVTAWRHLILDINFRGTLPDTPTSAAPGDDQIRVYIADSLAALDQQPDSAYTEGVNLFTLAMNAQLGTSWGTEAAAWPRRVASGSGLDPVIWPAKRLWIDLYVWKGSCPAELYVRIVVVNRGNPAGRIRVGPAFLGVGWRPTWNVRADAPQAPSERTSLDRTPDGVVHATYRVQGRTVGFESSEFTPSEAAILRTALLDARMVDDEQPHALVPDPNLNATTRPVWVLDPANRSPLVSERAKAAGMILGHISSFSLNPVGEGLGQGYHKGSIVIEGEA